MKSPAILLHPTQKSSLCPVCPHDIHHPPVSHVVAISVTRATATILQYRVKMTLTLLNNSPKAHVVVMQRLSMKCERKDFNSAIICQPTGHMEKNIIFIVFILSAVSGIYWKVLEYSPHVFQLLLEWNLVFKIYSILNDIIWPMDLFTQCKKKHKFQS